MVAFTVSATLAGVAGGLLAQITQTVALSSLSFDRSAAVLIMVMIGGMGTLIGALVGAAAYMVAQDRLSDLNPVYWNFWVGLLLVLFVLFARGGMIGGLDRLDRVDPRQGARSRDRSLRCSRRDDRRRSQTDSPVQEFRCAASHERRQTSGCRAAAGHALIGPNGSGKTTLINLLGGALAPTSAVRSSSAATISRGSPR